MACRRSAPGRAAGPGRRETGCPSLAKIAAAAAFSQVTVTRYGKTETIAAPRSPACGTPSPAPAPVTVVLIRDKSKTGYDLALVTTENAAGHRRR